MGEEGNNEEPRIPFPYEPYSIQKQFMTHVYQCVDQKKIGIFESPTGTGKTLSLISSLLYWRQTHPPQVLRGKDDPALALSLSSSTSTKRQSTQDSRTSTGQDPDWLSKSPVNIFNKESTILRKKLEERIEAINRIKDVSLKELVSDKALSKMNSKRPRDEDTSPTMSEGGSAKAFQIAEQLRSQRAEEEDCAETPAEAELYVEKIVFSSRTHSQLAQFVEELQKTHYFEDIRTITLAGRKHLCVNEEVRKLGDESAITERCLELKDNASKNKSNDNTANKGCPYLSSKKVATSADKFLSQPRDIEDMKMLGSEACVCPYYASHKAVPLADVVLVPYNLLLNAEARESLGINLNKSIVVIDEAHNLESAIFTCYESVIDNTLLKALHCQLTAYHERYKNRLAGPSSSLCLQIDSLLSNLISFVDELNRTSQASSILKVSEFIRRANLEHTNPWEIVRSMRTTQLHRKIRGFVRWYRVKSSDKMTREQTFYFSKGNAVNRLQGFLDVLCLEVQNARISIQKKDKATQIKYFLLDASGPLNSIERACRSLIFAGGTMHPIEDFIASLLPGATQEKVLTFSCGHVIPSDSIHAVTLPKGLRGQTFDFSLASRSNASMVLDLGVTLINLCRRIPGGVVIFVPSFDYCAFLLGASSPWRTENSFSKSSSIFQMLQNQKYVFREPSKREHYHGNESTDYDYGFSNESSMTSVWRNYKELAIKDSPGALLFCIAGGTMSEGINFSDNLARCVGIIGMPFPHIGDPELQARMNWFESRETGTGNRYYEGLCMKTVNQSIGRAFRHKDDYATIVLFDHRYAKTKYRQKITPWIASNMYVSNCATETLDNISKFCSKHATTQLTTEN